MGKKTIKILYERRAYLFNCAVVVIRGNRIKIDVKRAGHLRYLYVFDNITYAISEEEDEDDDYEILRSSIVFRTA